MRFNILDKLNRIQDYILDQEIASRNLTEGKDWFDAYLILLKLKQNHQISIAKDAK